jgi:hypothetical protein
MKNKRHCGFLRPDLLSSLALAAALIVPGCLAKLPKPAADYRAKGDSAEIPEMDFLVEGTVLTAYRGSGDSPEIPAGITEHRGEGVL